MYIDAVGGIMARPQTSASRRRSSRKTVRSRRRGTCLIIEAHRRAERRRPAFQYTARCIGRVRAYLDPHGCSRVVGRVNDCSGNSTIPDMMTKQEIRTHRRLVRGMIRSHSDEHVWSKHTGMMDSGSPRPAVPQKDSAKKAWGIGTVPEILSFPRFPI